MQVYWLMPGDDGFDILFTSSDGYDKIPYEREKYINSYRRTGGMGKGAIGQRWYNDLHVLR